jgi:hypothetical protein
LSGKIGHSESGARNTDGDTIEEVHGGAEPWAFTKGGTRVVVEVATAYAITKAALPLRIALSIWATPWFARVAVSNVASIVSHTQRWVCQTWLFVRGKR